MDSSSTDAGILSSAWSAYKVIEAVIARAFLWGSIVGLIYKTESSARLGEFLVQSVAQLRYLFQLLGHAAELYLNVVRFLLSPVVIFFEYLKIDIPTAAVDAIPGVVALTSFLVKRLLSEMPVWQVYRRTSGITTYSAYDMESDVLAFIKGRDATMLVLVTFVFVLFVADLAYFEGPVKSVVVTASAIAGAIAFVSAILLLASLITGGRFLFPILVGAFSFTDKVQLYVRYSRAGEKSTVRYISIPTIWRLLGFFKATENK